MVEVEVLLFTSDTRRVDYSTFSHVISLAFSKTSSSIFIVYKVKLAKMKWRKGWLV